MYYYCQPSQSPKPLNKTEEPLRKEVLPAVKHTPPSIFSASLRAGLFDTNVSLLHTCSLPDLRILFATYPNKPEDGAFSEDSENDEGSDLEEVAEEGDSPEEGESSSDEGASPSERGNPSDDEGSGDDGSEDEEDDDLQQLVKTLQSFVEDASASESVKLLCYTFLVAFIQ